MTLPTNPTIDADQIAALVAQKLLPSLDKVSTLLDDGKMSYSVRRLAELTDVSRTELYEAIKRGDLVPSYPTSNAVILRDEAVRWLMSLPNEEPKR